MHVILSPMRFGVATYGLGRVLVRFLIQEGEMFCARLPRPAVWCGLGGGALLARNGLIRKRRSPHGFV